jgi:RimJ/RimL family protein N-acetyltransferase
MQIAPTTLSGQYVRLELLTFAHETALNKAAADGELWNTDVTIIPKADGMHAYIQFALAGLNQGTQLPFIIVQLPGNQIVGTTRFYDVFPNDRKCAIGYTWLAKSAQRTPVNTEAKVLMLTYAFETWKCVRVELITDVRNELSRAAILRLGAKQEGVLRKHIMLPSGRIRDSVVFSILDTEWPDVKAHLLARLKAGT